MGESVPISEVSAWAVFVALSLTLMLLGDVLASCVSTLACADDSVPWGLSVLVAVVAVSWCTSSSVSLVGGEVLLDEGLAGEESPEELDCGRLVESREDMAVIVPLPPMWYHECVRNLVSLGATIYPLPCFSSLYGAIKSTCLLYRFGIWCSPPCVFRALSSSFMDLEFGVFIGVDI